ncbi:MAG: DNA cytosine methyltransferase, partial [Mesorhizobium sp.]
MNVALCPEHIDILSLCTGGGGLDLGVELAIPGARTVCMVEREAFAVAHLVSAMEQGLLHQAPIWSDARTFDGRAWRGCVDGLIGGIPCQPHSLAGKRLGGDDERDLWSPARRIIVQSGAWFVLIENVAGMLSAKPGLDPGALRVWRDLRRLGFDVEAGLFTAAEVGASHERERVFILGVADAGRLCVERWRTAGDLVRAAIDRKGQGQEREWHRP